jgi:DnaJ-class molecular chaperone
MRRVSNQVPSTGWVKIGTLCVHCMGKGPQEVAACVECGGTGETEVAVNLNAFVNYIGEEMMRQIRLKNPNLGR